MNDSQHNYLLEKCDKEPNQKIHIWLSKNPFANSIAFLQLTEDQTISLLNQYWFLKDKQIGLTCNSHRPLNCWIWIESFAILLNKLGYIKPCRI